MPDNGQVKLTIDLGQVILIALGSFLTIIGYLIKREISSFGERLDKIEERSLDLAGAVQRLIGYYTALTNGKTPPISSQDHF